MHINDELFRLIKSLNKSEKRYFKIFSERHVIRGQNNYIRLFDFLEKQNEYSEEKSRTYFAGQKFVQHLEVTKNYLTKMIMQSLRAFYDKAVPADIVTALIRDSKILLEKGFNERAYKVLLKAKVIAEQYNLYPRLLEILDLELRLGSMQNSLIKVNEIQEAVFKKKEEVINILNNINEYNKLIARIFSIVRHTNVIREKNEMKQLNEIMNHRLFRDEKNALSFYAKLKFLDVWSIYYGMVDDHNKSMRYSEKYIALLESSSFMRDSHPGTYIPALNNFVLLCLRMKRFDDAWNTIEKLRKFRHSSKRVQAEVFQRLSDLELNYFKVTGQFEKGMDAIPDIEKEKEKYKAWLQRSLDVELILQYSCIYLGSGNYKMALYWINSLLSESREGLRDDLQCSIRIMNLIVHYELGNQLLLPYILKSTYRFFYERNATYEFETIFLKNIRKLADADTESDLKEVYKKIHPQLIRLSKNKFEKGAFEIFDFVSWLESKIENRPFADVVKQKLRAIKKPS